jgi:uncharacterized protein YcbX
MRVQRDPGRRSEELMDVLAIWRYPVKAMLGERLDAVRIGPSGCTGDRRWVVVDADTRERIANKRGPTDPRLRACRAELLDDGEHELPPRVTLPDGQILDACEIEDALSLLLQRRTRLETSGTPALGRFGAPGAHHDAAPVHLVTTSTLAHLRTIAPGSDWDVRRFRPNLVLDDSPTSTGFAEDELLGGRLRGHSGIELTVGLPTPRCVVPRGWRRTGVRPRRGRMRLAHQRLVAFATTRRFHGLNKRWRLPFPISWKLTSRGTPRAWARTSPRPRAGRDAS